MAIETVQAEKVENKIPDQKSSDFGSNADIGEIIPHGIANDALESQADYIKDEKQD